MASLFSTVRRSVERQRAQKTTLVPQLRDLAFGVQLEAIFCLAALVCLCCSGRAGKTRGALLKWLEVADRKPGQLSAFIGLTLKSAKRTAWQQLKRLDKELGLGLRFNIQDLSVTHPNGSALLLLGANRDDLIDVLRGSPFAFVYLDEVAFFREGLVKRLIDDVLIIRMLDLDGELWIGSTPGYVESGYHYEIVSGQRKAFIDEETGREEGWRVFHWTFFDNPHLPEYPREPDAEKRKALRLKVALRTRQRMGWTVETPSYVRDWLGRYVRDLGALVYGFDRALHTIDAMPDGWSDDAALRDPSWHTVLGEDYGSTNATAWVLWAFKKHSPIAYCVRAFKHYGRSPSECADITRDMVEQYSPDVIVGDSAAKGYIDEHRIRHKIAIQGADKQHKRAHQITMNDSFRAQPEPRIYLLRGATDEYADELERLGKDPRFPIVLDPSGKVVWAHPRHGEENPQAENDLCDAGLYGWYRCRAWIEEFERKAAEEQAKQERARRDPFGGTAVGGIHTKPKPVRHEGLRGGFGVASLARFKRNR